MWGRPASLLNSNRWPPGMVWEQQDCIANWIGESSWLCKNRPHRVKLVTDPPMIYLLDVNALVALGFINHEIHACVAS